LADAGSEKKTTARQGIDDLARSISVTIDQMQNLASPGVKRVSVWPELEDLVLNAAARITAAMNTELLHEAKQKCAGSDQEWHPRYRFIIRLGERAQIGADYIFKAAENKFELTMLSFPTTLRSWEGRELLVAILYIGARAYIKYCDDVCAPYKDSEYKDSDDIEWHARNLVLEALCVDDHKSRAAAKMIWN
jgi:hypothetical protein